MAGTGEQLDEIEVSLRNTFARAARRNERIIAMVRLGMLSVFALIELYWAWTGTGIPFYWRVPTFVYLGLSAALFAAMSRGWHVPWLRVAIPLLDLAFLAGRMQIPFVLHSLDTLRESMEMATVIGVCCLVVLTDAYRLDRRGLVAVLVGAEVVYVWFGVQAGLVPAQLLVHMTIIASVGGLAVGLLTQVRRAVRSEVGQLTLARFLPKRVIDQAHHDPMALLTTPRAVEATVLITDIRGFTSWAETKTPIEVLGYLNIIQGTLAEAVRAHGGMVDKFLGDGMLAVFGAPDHLDDHAIRAMRAVKDIRSAMTRLQDDPDAPTAQIGLGMHSGDLVCGCLGSGPRLEFTILGDTVNTTSRLEALTKEHGVASLISMDTVARLADQDGLREVGEVPIRGRQEPMRVFTLD